ncbi:MAG: DUF2243 domain-containing protein [Polyangiaceae bacterium]
METVGANARREGTVTQWAPKREASCEAYALRQSRAELSSGVLIGSGMGGFIDGILFHQILQWHNMLSTIRPPTDLVAMKYNMLWDGIFHAMMWCLTAFGILRLWMAIGRGGGRSSGKTLSSGMLIGWGAFNFCEGLVDHQILGLHHVRPSSDQVWWDVAFLCSGIVLLLAGVALKRGGQGG